MNKLIIGFLFLCIFFFITAEETHIIDDVIMAKPKEMKNVETRLSEAINDYKQYLPIKRIAFFNIAYPKDINEYNALQGSCVLEVIACAQNPDELPIKNLRIITELGVYNYDYTFSCVADNLGMDKIKGLGKKRGHFYYIIPYRLLHGNGSILFDYNINRNDFMITTLPITDDHDYPLTLMHSDDVSTFIRLVDFISREFEVEFVKK